MMNNLGEKAQPWLEAGAGSGLVTGFAPDRAVSYRVTADEAGQRIDNFLLKLAKGVPKSHVYRVIRGGEVRVNRKRVDAAYRLEEGDELRLPPMRLAQRAAGAHAARPAEFPILLEDEHVLIVDKPAGVAVHGGSGVSSGVIEQLRAARPQARFLELVHRLDRETSGILMIAKKRTALTCLHEDFREGRIDKRYLVLVAGEWKNARQHAKAALTKYLLPDGERRVRVDPDGQAAHTVFSLKENLGPFSLLEAELKTGRTHQIRVHLAHLGYPIVGDDKYGDFALNKRLARTPDGSTTLRRMFLHACQLRFTHPHTGVAMTVEAPLPAECADFLEGLRHARPL